MLVNIYIPKDNTELNIKDGSAIVGVPVEDGLVKLYFEGNLYGSVNLHLYKERVLVAALRLRDKCPTVAMNVLPKEALILVGQYNTETDSYFIKEEALLSAWADCYKRNVEEYS